MSRKLLSPQECKYIQHELSVDIPRRQKLALQRLCSSHARGYSMPASSLFALQQTLGGTIVANSTSPKVRRWALNTVALFGTKDGSLNAVLYATDKYQNDPEIFSSAISALVRLAPNQFHSIATSANFSREAVLLSGLRTAGPERVDVRDLRINIETAEPEILKLALLTVGLDRAPSYMFHPSHDNGEIVKVLGSHDQDIVCQYSVWAIAENSNLGPNHLGVPINDMEALRPNVRGWVYRLYAEDPAYSHLKHDLVVQGSVESDPDIRLSLSTGLRNTFYDGIEEVIFPWFEDETDAEVKAQLIEHMVRQSERYPGYAPLITNLFAAEPAGSIVRQRMEAAAYGTATFGDLQRIAQQVNQPLFANFGEVNFHMGDKKEYNIGNIFAGAVSLDGNAENLGNVQNNLTIAQSADLKAILEKILAEHTALPIQENEKKQLSAAAVSAQQEPSKDRISAVVGVLKKIEGGLKYVADSGEHVIKIAGYVALLSAFL